MKNSKRKYVPHLAEFYFEPDEAWSVGDARKLYTNAKFQCPVDAALYEDCVAGMQRLPGECVDLVVADPPFGIDFTGKENLYNRKSENVVGGYVEVSNAEYPDFSTNWVRELPRIMKDTATAYIFSGWSNLQHVLNAAASTGLHLINHIIWKYQFSAYASRKFSSSHYHVLLLAKNPASYYFNNVTHYNEDVWDIGRDYEPAMLKNATKLPAEVVQRCVEFSSKPGDLVLDPFLGNGTTAVVATGLYRHFLGYELNLLAKVVIEGNISRVLPGENYIPYVHSDETIALLARKYPAAYKEYLRQKSRQKTLFA